MQGLDQQAESLREALKAVYVALTLHIAETQRSRNSYTTIHQIPSELLVKIFHAVLDSVEEAALHFQKLHKLARVCHRWNRIAKMTPSLWAYITTNNSPRLTEIALARSLEVPLCVDLDLRRGSPMGYANFLEASKHIHRVGSLTLKSDGPEPLSNHLEVPAPLITHCDISCVAAGRSIDLFRGQTSRLRHLRLDGFIIPFRTPMVSGLHHLELRNIRSDLSAETLLHVLSASPTLASLIIQGVGGSSAAVPGDHPPVVLSHLVTLHLTHLSSQYIYALLRGIRAPSCSTFVLQCTLPHSEAELAPVEDPTGTTFLAGALHHHIDSLKRIISNSRWSSFQLHGSEREFRYAASGTIEVLNIKLWPVIPTRTFPWFVNEFQEGLGRTSAALTLESVMLSHLDFLRALGQLERVTDIVVDKWVHDLDGLLDYLRQPYTSESGIQRWRLPHLKHLSIWQIRNLGGLLPMLRSRYGKDDMVTIDGVSIPLHGELPGPLEKLEVNLQEPGLEGDLREVVGDALVGLQQHNGPGVIVQHGQIFPAPPTIFPHQPPVFGQPFQASPPNSNWQPYIPLPEQPPIIIQQQPVYQGPVIL